MRRMVRKGRDQARIDRTDHQDVSNRLKSWSECIPRIGKYMLCTSIYAKTNDERKVKVVEDGILRINR